MKKVLAAVLSAILLITAVPALASGEEHAVMSSETLDIVSHLNDYNEEEARKAFAEGSAEEILFAKDGSSAFCIVYPSSASETVIAAAQELSKYLNQIIGAGGTMFPVVPESTFSGGPFISLGHTALAADVDTSGIRDDGYLVHLDYREIYILTADDETIFNGVYGFLEDKMDCMFVREDYDYVPQFPTIYFEPQTYVSNPDFAWRKVFQYEVAQNGWYRKLKNNGAVAEDIEQNAGWGTWCHSCFTFVPPE